MNNMECNPLVARQIEEISINAWPSLSTMVYDGWLLRFAAGQGRRANSVNALYPSSLSLERKLDYCEQAYGAAGSPAIFKISPAVQPADLEQLLIRHGYEVDAPTAVQILNVAGSLPSAGGPGRCESCALDQWLPQYGSVSATGGDKLATFGKMAARILPPSVFMRLTVNGTGVAVGMAVLERDCVGLYNLEVHQGYRRQGLGAQLALSLVGWGRRQGAKMAYLFVMEDNAPGLALYAKLGFTHLYSYWFRTKTTDLLSQG
jgi:N-acetylglutamate synthase